MNSFTNVVLPEPEPPETATMKGFALESLPESIPSGGYVYGILAGLSQAKVAFN